MYIIDNYPSMLVDFNNGITNMSMETKYGKGIINFFNIQNNGIDTIFCNIKNNTTNYLLCGMFLSKILDNSLTLSVYEANNIPIPPTKYSISIDNYLIDIMYCPIPNKLDNNNNINFEFNPDVNIHINNNININTTMNGTVTGSIGKKYTVETNNNSDTLITITPDPQTIDELEENEYLIAYFEIEQTDNNDNKEIVILEKNEDPSISLDNPETDRNSLTSIYSHYQFNNGNLLLRYRDLNSEKETKYWLAFKSNEPIQLQAYKRIISNTSDNRGEATANLIFTYADENINPNTENYDVKTLVISVNANIDYNKELIVDSNLQVGLFTLDDSDTQLNYQITSNTSQCDLTFNTYFNCGRIYTFNLKNLGTRDLLVSGQSSNPYFYFLYDSYNSQDFEINSKSYISNISFNNLILLANETKQLRLLYVPDRFFLNNNFIQPVILSFTGINPTDVNLSPIYLILNCNPYANLFMFSLNMDIQVDNTKANSIITLIPDENDISKLENNQYLVTILQVNPMSPDDLNQDKRIILLEESEEPNNQLINNINNYDHSINYDGCRKFFDNGNIFFRNRDNDDDFFTTYFIFFKVSSPITLIAYQRDGCITGKVTPGNWSAKLVNFYLDPDGCYNPSKSINEIIYADSQFTFDSSGMLVLSSPTKASIAYIDSVNVPICPTIEDRLGCPLGIE